MDRNALASFVLAGLAVLGCGGPAGTSSPAAAPPTPPPAGESPTAAPSVHGSAALGYAVRLPAGWSAVTSSGDEDFYESADLQLSLAVGTGHPEPGQTVEDRVRINRETEFSKCTTDPSMDRNVTLAGERGVIWVFACGGISGLAANAIHGGVGYRLTLKAYGANDKRLEPLMAEIIAGFSFAD
jgi:hypothetical protein